MSITINKRDNIYYAEGLNSYGRYVMVTVPEDTNVKSIFNLVINEKSELERSKEQLMDNTQTLLDTFIQGKSDEEIVQNKHLFLQMVDDLKIIKGKIYRYADKLYRAKGTFTYNNQMNPINEPDKWDQLCKPKKSKYQELYDSATDWMRDQSYNEGVYVRRYGKLYQATARISDGSDPEAGGSWELVTEEKLNEAV